MKIKEQIECIYESFIETLNSRINQKFVVNPEQIKRNGKDLRLIKEMPWTFNNSFDILGYALIGDFVSSRNDDGTGTVKIDMVFSTNKAIGATTLDSLYPILKDNDIEVLNINTNTLNNNKKYWFIEYESGNYPLNFETTLIQVLITGVEPKDFL
jgi:hypothetical protein